MGYKVPMLATGKLVQRQAEASPEVEPPSVLVLHLAGTIARS